MRNLTNFELENSRTQTSRIRELKNLKNLQFNKLFLIKVYNVSAKKIKGSYIWWHWRLMQNLKENWFVLSKMTWRICQILAHRLKNSNFILESKMAELNQNKNSKQPDRQNAVWKLCFIYLGNKWIAQLTKLFTYVLQNRCSSDMRNVSGKLSS